MVIIVIEVSGEQGTRRASNGERDLRGEGAVCLKEGHHIGAKEGERREVCEGVSVEVCGDDGAGSVAAAWRAGSGLGGRRDKAASNRADEGFRVGIGRDSGGETGS